MRMSNWISDVCASDLRETGADGDVRRYSELPFDDLPAGLTYRSLRSRPDRTNEPIVVGRSELGADTGQRRYERSLEHMAPMIVGAIRQPRHSAGIRSGEPAKCDRATAGKGQPIPREQHAILPRHDLAVIFSDQARALGRSEEHTSELQSLMRISYAVFCLKKKNKIIP